MCKSQVLLLLKRETDVVSHQNLRETMVQVVSILVSQTSEDEVVTESGKEVGGRFAE